MMMGLFIQCHPINDRDDSGFFAIESRLRLILSRKRRRLGERLVVVALPFFSSVFA